MAVGRHPLTNEFNVTMKWVRLQSFPRMTIEFMFEKVVCTLGDEDLLVHHVDI